MKSVVSLLVIFFVERIYADSLKFVALGDWGGQTNQPYTTSIQLQVAKQIGETAHRFGSQFTLAIGDNFYTQGIPTDVNDKRFYYTFEKVYTAASLQSRWYLVAGNHDHNGNVTAQIAYTEKSHRWYFPNEWYTVTHALPGTNVTVQFVFFDTVDFPNEALKPQIINKLKRQPSLRADAQLEWIKQTLSESKADWLLVVGHYPVWSISSHGPTDKLVKSLNPLMKQYNVAAYFCGHDHNLQHIHDDSSPVEYYLTGAAHDIDISQSHKSAVPSGSSKFFWPAKSTPHGGFNTVEIKDKHTMEVVFYDDEGNELYTHTKTNPRAQ